MNKAEQLIQETEKQTQILSNQASQLENSIKQAEQQLQQILFQHNAIATRLSTLKEIYGMGATFLLEIPTETVTILEEEVNLNNI